MLGDNISAGLSWQPRQYGLGTLRHQNNRMAVSQSGKLWNPPLPLPPTRYLHYLDAVFVPRPTQPETDD